MRVLVISSEKFQNIIYFGTEVASIMYAQLVTPRKLSRANLKELTRVRWELTLLDPRSGLQRK